jgi:hypothetical protein
LMASAVTIVAIVFSQTSYLRYVFPVLGLFSAIIGLVVACSENSFGLMLRASAGAVVLSNTLILFAGSSWFSSFPISTILTAEKRNDYLEVSSPIRRAVELVNQVNTISSPVPFFSSPFAAGLNADALYANWYNHIFQNELSAAKTSAEIAAIFNTRNVEFIVADGNWVSWPNFSVLKSALPEITDTVAEVGSVEIRRRKSETRFLTELLKNSKFDAIDGWSVAAGAEHSSATGTVSVSVSKSVSQAVPVGSGQKFLNTIMFRCLPNGNGAVARVQVNWLDKNGNFVSTNIQTSECTTDWKSFSQIVTAPKGASIAIVYGVSHTEQPVEISELSFKR